MTIRYSSGPIALQNAGTNVSETVTNVLLNTPFTTGVDSSFKIWMTINDPVQGHIPVEIWSGTGYGFNDNIFSTENVHDRFKPYVLGAYGDVKYGNPTAPSFGSITYNAFDSTTSSNSEYRTRHIAGIFWGIPDSSSPNDHRLFVFAVARTGGSSEYIVNNHNNTFEKLEITTSGGTTVSIDRYDIAYIDQDENGNTWWYWYGTSTSSGDMYTHIGNLGTPSNNSEYTLKVINGTLSGGFRNGIAEEMGGANSSNVKLSDYYSPGTYIGSNLSVPSSGEIKFSDFFGKTHKPLPMAKGTFDNYYGQPQGSYLYQAGFVKGSHTGQTGNINTFTCQSTTVEVSTVVNLYSSLIVVAFDNTATSGNKTYTDTGWDCIKVWHNQSDGNGAPDWTLDRTDAYSFITYNYTGGNGTGQAQWFFNGDGGGAGEWPFADFMTTSNSDTHYIEID